MYAILMEIEWQREEVLFLGTKKMTFIIQMLRRFVFSFTGSDIQRLIAELKEETLSKQTGVYAKEVDFVLLTPHQARALRTMQKYAPRQQVCELFELYEKANSTHPVDPATAVRVARRDIFPPQETKELFR